jgi:hypothetical protein
MPVHASQLEYLPLLHQPSSLQIPTFFMIVHPVDQTDFGGFELSSGCSGCITAGLERETFQWPAESEAATRSISPRELRWLLDGLTLEQREAHIARSRRAGRGISQQFSNIPCE